MTLISCEVSKTQNGFAGGLNFIGSSNGHGVSILEAVTLKGCIKPAVGAELKQHGTDSKTPPILKIATSNAMPLA